MLIIVSKDISLKALVQLEKFGEVMLFGTENITYNAIQNHPDVFICQLLNAIIAAPNIPNNFLSTLISKGTCCISGQTYLGEKYPNTAMYNAVVTEKYLFHNLSLTDKVIKNKCQHLKQLHVNQGYCRCNLVALPNNTFITSDKGIMKVLENENLSSLYVNPENISLDGFTNGFFGGCCGISKKYFFINGSLNFLNEKTDIERFVNKAQLQLVELSNERPEDIGGILIV